MNNNDFSDIYENTHTLEQGDLNETLLENSEETEKNDLNFEEKKLFLNIEEVTRFALFQEKQNRLKAEAINYSKEIEYKKLLLKNYELAILKDVTNLKDQLISKNSEISNSKSDYEEYVETLSEKYSLTSKWGYDPDTGEIDKNETDET